jgi:hypothetical protein
MESVPLPEIVDLAGLQQYAHFVASAIRAEFAEQRDEEERWLALLEIGVSDADAPGATEARTGHSSP